MLEFAEALLNLAQSKKWTELLCVEAPLWKFLDQCEFPLNEILLLLHQHTHRSRFANVLVARTGSIMVSSAQSSGRGIPVYTPVHIVVAFPDQFVDDLKDAFNFLKLKYKDQYSLRNNFYYRSGQNCRHRKRSDHRSTRSIGSVSFFSG